MRISALTPHQDVYAASNRRVRQHLDNSAAFAGFGL
jgi:hypothetical protein